MISKILITNNSDNHSPATWAMAAAEILADVSQLKGPNAIDGQRLVIKFADVLTKHFDGIQKREQKNLQSDAEYVLSDIPTQLDNDLQKITKELVKTAKGTEWEQHYQLPAVHNAMVTELQRLLVTSMHIDRLAHVAKNPDCPYAAQYKVS